MRFVSLAANLGFTSLRPAKTRFVSCWTMSQVCAWHTFDLRQTLCVVCFWTTLCFVFRTLRRSFALAHSLCFATLSACCFRGYRTRALRSTAATGRLQPPATARALGPLLVLAALRWLRWLRPLCELALLRNEGETFGFTKRFASLRSLSLF